MDESRRPSAVVFFILLDDEPARLELLVHADGPRPGSKKD
jgi:hypothetical protein